MPATLILFNKPYGVLSQFRQDDNNDFATLSDFFYQDKHKNLRVAGRLDATSEGLLLLTDNGQFNQFLTHPPHVKNMDNIEKFGKPPPKKQGKTYWVQLDGNATDEQINQLRQGVVLKDGKTLPAQVERLAENSYQQLWQAPDAIAKRKITSWLSITIFEGKNRQVRRMTAHVGLPCLRLVRVAHGDWQLENLAVGEYCTLHLSDADLAKFGITAMTNAHTTKTSTTKKMPPKKAIFPQKKSAKAPKHFAKNPNPTFNMTRKNP